GGAGLRALAAADAGVDRARELDRPERPGALRPLRRAEQRRAVGRAAEPAARGGGCRGRDHAERPGRPPPHLGPRPVHDRRRPPLGPAGRHADLLPTPSGNVDGLTTRQVVDPSELRQPKGSRESATIHMLKYWAAAP